MTGHGGKYVAAEAWQGGGEGTRRKVECRKEGYSREWCGIKCALGEWDGGDSHRYSTLKS